MREIIKGFGGLPNEFDLDLCRLAVEDAYERIEKDINDGFVDDEDDSYKLIHQALLRVSNYLIKLNNENNGL
jgi:hypothetical protein